MSVSTRRIIAQVIDLSGRPQRVIPTTPGRKVEFHGGEAYVVDPRDMPHMLRDETLAIYPTAEWIDALPGWAQEAGEGPAPATVEVPEGFTWDGVTLISPEPPAPPEPAWEPPAPVDFVLSPDEADLILLLRLKPEGTLGKLLDRLR